MINFLSRLNYLRFSRWWNYLVPFLLGLIYVNLYIHKISFSGSLPFIFGFLLIISGTIAFGYFLNDVTDIETDSMAGKRNLAASNSSLKNVPILGLLILLSHLVWFLLTISKYNLPIYVCAVIIGIQLWRGIHQAIMLDSEIARSQINLHHHLCKAERYYCFIDSIGEVDHYSSTNNKFGIFFEGTFSVKHEIKLCIVKDCT